MKFIETNSYTGPLIKTQHLKTTFPENILIATDTAPLTRIFFYRYETYA